MLFSKVFLKFGENEHFFQNLTQKSKIVDFPREFSIFREKNGLARRYQMGLKKLCFWTWDYEKISTSSQHSVDCVLRLQYRFKSAIMEKPLFMFKNSLFSPERAGKSEFFHIMKAAIKCMAFKIVLGLNYKPLDTF